jgi:hypothetical protein
LELSIYVLSLWGLAMVSNEVWNMIGFCTIVFVHRVCELYLRMVNHKLSMRTGIAQFSSLVGLTIHSCKVLTSLNMDREVQ